MPYLAFGVFLLVNAIAGSNLTVFYPYAFVILLLIGAELLSKGHPGKQLLIFSMCGIAALICGMLTTGLVSVYAFISVFEIHVIYHTLFSSTTKTFGGK
jgi:FHS family L-fucose permease-like MFS transporter